MGGWRRLALAGAVSVAAACAAAPAGAATVVLTPNASLTFASPFFSSVSLASYLSDAQGRTFAITSATLSVSAHSDPDYGQPVTFSADVPNGFTIVSVDPPAVEYDFLHEHLFYYRDDAADVLFLDGEGRTVSGTVSQTLDTTETTVTDERVGPYTGPGFPSGIATQRDTYEDIVNRHAIYGSLSLSEDFDAAGLAEVNATGVFDVLVGGGDHLADLNHFASQFVLDSVSLSFDLTQTGGPPLGAAGVPEPAAWALMLAGFGLAGAGLRRRRSLAVAS